MLNENRFLDTFRGHNIRLTTSIFCIAVINYPNPLSFSKTESLPVVKYIKNICRTSLPAIANVGHVHMNI